MKTYYMFRHGITNATKYKRMYGIHIYTAKILPESFPIYIDLAKFIKSHMPDHFVSSEFLRCRQTVDVVSFIINKKFTFDKRLNEYIVYKERFSSFKKRLQNFIDEMEKTDYEKIAICTHGAGIAVLTQLLLNKPCTIGCLRENMDPGVLRIISSGNLKDISFRETPHHS